LAKRIEALIWTFFLTQSFSPVICLGFGVWVTPGAGGWVSRVILVLKTFLELVQRSV